MTAQCNLCGDGEERLEHFLEECEAYDDFRSGVQKMWTWRCEGGSIKVGG